MDLIIPWRLAIATTATMLQMLAAVLQLVLRREERNDDVYLRVSSFCPFVRRNYRRLDAVLATRFLPREMTITWQRNRPFLSVKPANVPVVGRSRSNSEPVIAARCLLRIRCHARNVRSNLTGEHSFSRWNRQPSPVASTGSMLRKQHRNRITRTTVVDVISISCRFRFISYVSLLARKSHDNLTFIS